MVMAEIAMTSENTNINNNGNDVSVKTATKRRMIFTQEEKLQEGKLDRKSQNHLLASSNASKSNSSSTPPLSVSPPITIIAAPSSSFQTEELQQQQSLSPLQVHEEKDDDEDSTDLSDDICTLSMTRQPEAQQQHATQIPDIPKSTLYTFSENTFTGRVLTAISTKFLNNHPPPDSDTNSSTFNFNSTTSIESNIRSGSALAGFLALLLVTCANYMLSPMRDAAALHVGVTHIPLLTLASTILALGSSVPVGWLFEAPNPERRGRRWRGKIGLTRGETQGTSLALFYRCFAVCLIGYALGFKIVELFWEDSDSLNGASNDNGGSHRTEDHQQHQQGSFLYYWISLLPGSRPAIDFISKLLLKFGHIFYIAFFLVVHLMKLHSLSLIWGVTSEAMEYEEQAELRERRRKDRLLLMGTNVGANVDCIGKVTGVQNQTLQNYSDEGTVGVNAASSTPVNATAMKSTGGGRNRARLKRLAFVGFGGTLGGILGSVIVSITAHTLRLSGLLIVAAILLELSAELSVELGQIMLRHWEEEHLEEEIIAAISLNKNTGKSVSADSGAPNNETCQIKQDLNLSSINDNVADSSMKKVPSSVSMKRVASGSTLNNHDDNSTYSSTGQVAEGIDPSMKKVASLGSMKRVASGNSISNIRRAKSTDSNLSRMDNNSSNNKSKSSSLDEGNTVGVSSSCVTGPTKNSASTMDDRHPQEQNAREMEEQQLVGDDNSFKQRLLRGITTILRSRLLMTIFTYNALYATTSVLLSFQRAELVANRKSSSSSNSVDSDTAFLARINMASSVAVFALQASGLGAFIANSCGQRGTLSLMPIVRSLGVALLAWWHVKADGKPPNLTLFLVLDEFTKVINFAVAKPVRESLWVGLSNEARYEAKPIVDTLANRWGGGSAAFLMSLLDRIINATGLGEVSDDGTKTLFGFPPILILCSISAAWWAMVSADLGHIRHRIDLELKKQQ